MGYARNHGDLISSWRGGERTEAPDWKCQSMARRLTESNMWEEAHGLWLGVLTLLGLVVVAGLSTRRGAPSPPGDPGTERRSVGGGLCASQSHGSGSFQQRLDDIDMGKAENDAYQSYFGRVEAQVAQLSSILENVRARAKERTWIKHTTYGELDDAKIVDGAAGETSLSGVVQKTLHQARSSKNQSIFASC